METKKFFDQPVADVVRFASVDIIATSGDGSTFNPLSDQGDANG